MITALDSAERDVRAQAESHAPLWKYLKNARWQVVASSPFIYLCLIPFLLLDLFMSIYQSVCFPIYDIPKVHRNEFMIFDRARLPYLNALERLNCVYCSYANGVIAYTAEIAGRTEQHWCPIRHSETPPILHSRYRNFLPYGDSQAYRNRVEDVRRSFADIESRHAGREV